MIGANSIKNASNNLLAWGFHFRVIENNKKMKIKLATYILIGASKLRFKIMIRIKKTINMKCKVFDA